MTKLLLFSKRLDVFEKLDAGEDDEDEDEDDMVETGDAVLLFVDVEARAEAS